MSKYLINLFLYFCLFGAVYSQVEPSELACGTEWGCFRYPESCVYADCEFAVSWQTVDELSTLFEVSGTLSPDLYNTGEFYIAFGMSETNDMKVGSVVDCIYSESNDSQITIQSSYNIEARKQNEVNEDPLLGLVEESFSGYTDPDHYRIVCRFERLNSVPSTDPEADRHFPVSPDIPYFILLASGSVTDTIKDRHAERVVTDDAVTFTDIQVIDDIAIELKLKLHGIFMVIAWIMFAGLGIITARFGKDIGNGKMLCNIKPWFHIHRFCMITAWGFGVAGIVIIFVHVDGFSDTRDWSPDITQSHPYIGNIAMALAVINVFLGLIRPGADSTLRSTFNWCHRLVGTGAFILAVLNTITGIEIPISRSAFTDEWMWILLTIYVIIHVLTELALLYVTKYKKFSVGSKATLELKPPGSSEESVYRSKNTDSATHLIMGYSVVAFGIALAIIIAIAMK